MTQNDDKPASEESSHPADKRAPRKERVLHTRVPAVLEQELKRLAEGLRVPVSNVVRTILEDAVDTIDSVGQLAEGELRGVAERLAKHRGRLRKSSRERSKPDRAEVAPKSPEPPAEPPLAGIVGYQPLLLARDERCGLCGRALVLGEQAYLGIREVPGGPRVIIGRECLPTSAAAEPSPTTEPTEEQVNE
ncbi:MAG: hypothetical protein JRI68_09320 [Deltaproteobacteria bacterium]|nr:hypothetical protein [Deltaproteobacteria bacterium]